MQTDRYSHTHTDKKTKRQTNTDRQTQTDGLTDRQTDTHTHTHTHTQANRQTDTHKQTDRHIYTQTHTHAHTHSASTNTRHCRSFRFGTDIDSHGQVQGPLKENYHSEFNSVKKSTHKTSRNRHFYGESMKCACACVCSCVCVCVCVSVWGVFAQSLRRKTHRLCHV